jgi:hypothetical protein
MKLAMATGALLLAGCEPVERISSSFRNGGASLGDASAVPLGSAFVLALILAIALGVPSAAWARVRVTITFAWRHGYMPNLARPQVFNEWVQWRKLYDRDLALAALTDKQYAKAVAADRIGPSLVIPTLWFGDRLPPVAPWPMPFIVKANHGCRQFVVVRSDHDWRLAKREAPEWLARTYGTWLDEWHYKCARRALLVEPFVGPDEGLPVDYKVFVFGGVAEFIQVHLDRHFDHRWIYFNSSWERLTSTGAEDIQRPAWLAEMLNAAELMAQDRDHLRVDFYEVKDGFRFGETCLFPGSGLDRFDPASLDLAFGRFWTESRSTAVKEQGRRAKPSTGST